MMLNVAMSFPFRCSEAPVLDLLGDHLLDALDVVGLLALQVTPKVLQGRLAVGIGDVLVVAPQGVQPLAQVVDQVVVVSLQPQVSPMCSNSFSAARVMGVSLSSEDRVA
jgi:hypothetical protein